MDKNVASKSWLAIHFDNYKSQRIRINSKKYMHKEGEDLNTISGGDELDIVLNGALCYLEDKNLP